MMAVSAHQGVVSLRMRRERDFAFADALQQRERSQKPLLVVGGPYGSMITGRLLGIPAHGHGDVCLDLDPDSCGEEHFVHGDIRNIPFTDSFFGAAFCSHVLEHLATPDDCALAYSELLRVADRVFVCVPKRDSVVAWLSREHFLWVEIEGGEFKGSVPMRPQRVLSGVQMQSRSVLKGP